MDGLEPFPEFAGGKGAAGVGYLVGQIEDEAEPVSLAIHAGVDIGQGNRLGRKAPAQAELTLESAACRSEKVRCGPL